MFLDFTIALVRWWTRPNRDGWDHEKGTKVANSRGKTAPLALSAIAIEVLCENLNQTPPCMCNYTYVVARRIFWCGGLYRVGYEAEDRSDPQEDRESAKQLFAELDPLGDRLGRTEHVWSVAVEYLASTLCCQALYDINVLMTVVRMSRKHWSTARVKGPWVGGSCVR